MDRVETGVTARLEQTLERLAAINEQQRDQQQTNMNARLMTLEAKVQSLQQQSQGVPQTQKPGGANRRSLWADGGTTPQPTRLQEE